MSAAWDVLPPLTLVLGGARSGKSRYAEGLVESQDGSCIYLATATAGDVEMEDRIARHRVRRGERWETVEVPLELAGALQTHASGGQAVMVDCLTLWLSNLMFAEKDPERACEELVQVLPGLSGPVVFVSNEVGLGIVPGDSLSRAFRDHAGLLHQALADVCDSVVFMVAGLPHHLKPTR